MQDHSTDGYRFRDETATLIVPLMRGGEPMALGVSKAFQIRIVRTRKQVQ
jgi:uracil phosphoribosyltransferase